MNETMTVKKAIEITRDLLGDIEVPVKHKKIADTIEAAIGNLNAILNAMEAVPEEEQHEDDKPEGENADS